MTFSKDYHDYVFKDGKLIGKFDEMYRYSAEIPWHQDKSSCKVFSDIDIAILKQFKYGSICEIGCGLGYFSNRLHKELESTGEGQPKVTGIDISQAAIEKAIKQFPEIHFIAKDLRKESLQQLRFDLVVVKQVTWYVVDELKQFLQNVEKMIKEDGFLYVSESFPGTDKWVGQDVVDNHERLKEILMQYAKPIHYCIEWSNLLYKNGYIHFLGKKLKNG